MEHWTDFVLARYNYWIVIVLMMMGLYIVFARGNLVKKIVGLNIFQTSVFIFYITIGKVVGGTAPIYIGKDLKAMKAGHGDDHGDGHGGGHDESGAADHSAGHESDHSAVADHAEAAASSLHGKIDNALGANELKSAASGDYASSEAASLHDAPAVADKITNNTLAADGKDAAVVPGFEVTQDHAAPDGAYADTAAGYGEIIYTNPLPHVLILTAIVVGVAGTAVGLALAVRIREAYGTIEEDELETIDNVAEFGDAARLRAEASA